MSLIPKTEWTTISSRRAAALIDFAELRQYWDLLYFFVWRDIKVRYKQTVLGGLWAIIPPVFHMIVFTLVFGRFAKMPSDGSPYPLFYFAALVPWAYFSGAFDQAAKSLVGQAALMKKVYFPKLLLPVSSVIAAGLDFVLSMAILVGMMLWYQQEPTPYVMVMPLLVVILVATALGAGLLVGAINVKYRDFQHTVGFMVQFLMFASPVVYPASMLPEAYRLPYALNPMVGVIEGFRSALLGTTDFPWSLVAVSCAASVGLLLIGLRYFKKVELFFADVA